MTHSQVDPQLASASTAELSQPTHYELLGLHPAASSWEIRSSYRQLSKLYHPDTTQLPVAIAKVKFQQLNEAYGILSSPDKRSLYDLQIGYSRVNVIQAPSDYRLSDQTPTKYYTGPSDRPLSAGEIFALFLLLLTFVGCLCLAIVIAWLRGESAWQLPVGTLNVFAPFLVTIF